MRTNAEIGSNTEQFGNGMQSPRSTQNITGWLKNIDVAGGLQNPYGVVGASMKGAFTLMSAKDPNDLVKVGLEVFATVMDCFNNCSWSCTFNCVSGFV